MQLRSRKRHGAVAERSWLASGGSGRGEGSSVRLPEVRGLREAAVVAGGFIACGGEMSKVVVLAASPLLSSETGKRGQEKKNNQKTSRTFLANQAALLVAPGWY